MNRKISKNLTQNTAEEDKQVEHNRRERKEHDEGQDEKA